MSRASADRGPSYSSSSPLPPNQSLQGGGRHLVFPPDPAQRFPGPGAGSGAPGDHTVGDGRLPWSDGRPAPSQPPPWLGGNGSGCVMELQPQRSPAAAKQTTGIWKKVMTASTYNDTRR